MKDVERVTSTFQLDAVLDDPPRALISKRTRVPGGGSRRFEMLIDLVPYLPLQTVRSIVLGTRVAVTIETDWDAGGTRVLTDLVPV